MSGVKSWPGAVASASLTPLSRDESPEVCVRGFANPLFANPTDKARFIHDSSPFTPALCRSRLVRMCFFAKQRTMRAKDVACVCL